MLLKTFASWNAFVDDLQKAAATLFKIISKVFDIHVSRNTVKTLFANLQEHIIFDREWRQP